MRQGAMSASGTQNTAAAAAAAVAPPTCQSPALGPQPPSPNQGTIDLQVNNVQVQPPQQRNTKPPPTSEESIVSSSGDAGPSDTNPSSKPLQWVLKTGPNFEGGSIDGSTDESEYESSEESTDELRLKQGVDTQISIDDESSISKQERHPTLPHVANRPLDIQPTGPPPLQGVEASSSTSAVPPVGGSLRALHMQPAMQQYMREHAEAAIRRHNEELARARGDPRHPLYEHAPVFVYDPQSTALERYYANLQLIAQVVLSRGTIYPRSWALVDASLLGPYELQLEMLAQSNKMVMLMETTRQGGEYGDMGCTSYIDENGCVQPSGEELWWILKRGLDLKGL
ncbi:hypothetical protein V500_10794 [Pseudogymnoascus sp. VKM F-4518 (FW-2643)]|nr:hypothetical protein V500_10794 [Pseudogymnoascus sp. VKM F-4518 (FW-2643)]